ncbi:MAG: ABC transporter ATP-binding protein [Thermodesulfobacteriota bacterium]
MLQVKNINTFYGKSHVIHGISLEVNKGELVSLLGRNGAGKTTILRSITGLITPRSGNILYEGIDITPKKPFEICRAGIGYVPEDRRIFATLTLIENLNIAIQKNRQQQWDRERIFDIFPALAGRKKHRGKELSGGEQQMLSIARALMGNPSLLLLDEPTEGLAPLIVQTLIGVIERIKGEGVTVLLVEQNVESTFKVADRHYILEQGTIVYSGRNEELKNDKEVMLRYLSV